MYGYIKGIITEIESNYVILDNNGIGYIIYVANPYSYEKKEYTIYTYHYIREDENSLYGFKSKEEKELFLKLISVKGLGCRMALPMFATNSCSAIIDAIEHDNVTYLKKFPKIGDKLARQIILDLKGKLVSNSDGNANTKDFTELTEVLKGLGYKPADINRVLPNIKSDKVEEQVKEALKLMLK